jgi:hypothetical protein
MAARVQLEQMRHPALPAGAPGADPRQSSTGVSSTGQYL